MLRCARFAYGTQPGGGDSVGTQLLKAVAKAEAEERQREGQRQAQVAITAPRSGFVRFVDRCNGFYRDPANARLSMSDARQLFRCSRMTRMRDHSARA